MSFCYSVIDIGSNSVRMMLADQNGIPFEKRVITTRIGEEIQQTGRLSEPGIQRTVNAIENFIAISRKVKSKQIFAFATSAVRDAENREKFLRICENRFGLHVDVISGENEAQLAFRGAVAYGRAAKLLDIGGGSTELSAGKDNMITMASSVPFGAVRAAARYTDGSEGHILSRLAFQITDGEIWERKRNGQVTLGVANMKRILSRFKRAEGPLYGVGGTITSIASLTMGDYKSYNAARVHGYALAHSSARRILQELGSLGREGRESIPVLKGRSDIICFGGAILLECMDGLGAKNIIVSDSDNMEGYLYEKLDEIGKNRMRYVDIDFPKTEMA